VKGAARRAVDQSLIGHVFQQRFQYDLVGAVQAERLGDLAFARWHVGCRDELENLFAGGQADRQTFWHNPR